MPEVTYQYETENVAALCEHTSVEGVYERQLPLHTRALLKIGNLCGFDKSQPGILGKGLEQGFDLDVLLRNPDDSTYIPDKSAMSYLYLYHVAVGDRQVFALFSTARNDAQIIMQTQARDNQGLPSASRIYSDVRRNRPQDTNIAHGIFDYADQLDVGVLQTNTRRRTMLQLGEIVKRWKKEETRPTMLLIQSTQHAQIVHDVRLLADYPMLSLPSEADDSNMPPLGWQGFIFQKIMEHYLNLEAWISHLLELARYGDVPLCNLERDDPRFLIDLAYARRLQRSNIILWWSPNARPDHAGHENDDVTSSITDIVEMPAINTAGAYTSVCIDVQLRNLTINTILTSSLINDLETSGEAVSFNPEAEDLATGNNPNLKQRGAAGFAQPALVVLREMVKAWWLEACRGSTLADIMVTHLVRWVESPRSNLYDRNLQYYVQMMSKKAFQQLMMELRRVGSHVIYASQNRLLLQTSKQDVANAWAYSKYILESIQQKPLFRFIGLEIKDYWDVLVWYDPYNYGGRGCQSINESTSDASLQIYTHWQISEFLPKELQPIYKEWVVEFIDILSKLKRPELSDSQGQRATQLPSNGHTFLSLTENDPNSLEVTNVLTDFNFAKPLKKQIHALIKRRQGEMLHPEFATDWSFPELVGGSLLRSSSSKISSPDPILELVKALTQIVSLFKPLQLETRLLRKELLSLFDVREFASEAKFTNPSSSLRFESVICDTCTVARSIDLCRDEDILPTIAHDDSGNREIVQKTFGCAHELCNNEYSRVALEQDLISRIENMLVKWQSQDLECAKCRMLMGDDMVFSENCTKCGGAWTASVKDNEKRGMRDDLAVMERVAEGYGMKMLLNCLSDIRGLGL